MIYFSDITIQVKKYVQVLLEILKLIKLKKLQEFMSCVTICANNRSTLLVFNDIYNFFMRHCLYEILERISPVKEAKLRRNQCFPGVMEA